MIDHLHAATDADRRFYTPIFWKREEFPPTAKEKHQRDTIWLAGQRRWCAFKRQFTAPYSGAFLPYNVRGCLRPESTFRKAAPHVPTPNDLLRVFRATGAPAIELCPPFMKMPNMCDHARDLESRCRPWCE
jgi:hypothetical protein